MASSRTTVPVTSTPTIVTVSSAGRSAAKTSCAASGSFCTLASTMSDRPSGW